MNTHPAQHPRLTRTRYQALRQQYRLAVREDALEASIMPRLASSWHRRAQKTSRAAAVLSAVGPALAATFCRPEAPSLPSLARTRLAQRAARRGCDAVLARALAQIGGAA